MNSSILLNYLFIILLVQIVQLQVTKANNGLNHPNVLSQFATYAIDYEGENINCTDGCTIPTHLTSGGYSCSDGTGDWGSGKKAFIDPLPSATSSSSYLITQVTLNITGRFNCQEKSVGPSLNATLNDVEVSSFVAPSEPADCNCMACVRSVIVSSPYYPSGWPIYQYGKSNTFEIVVEDNYICVDTVEIILSYSQVSPYILAITPGSGPTTGNTNVSIWAGDPGFSSSLTYCCIFGSASIFINDVCVVAYLADAQQLTCISPSHTSPGAEELLIKIIENGGVTDTNQQFQYYYPPTILRLVPNTAAAGDTVFIVGESFANLASNRLIWGTQIIVNLNYMNDTCLNITVPTGTGTVQVSFSENGQQYTSNLYFTYSEVTPDEKKKHYTIPGWAWIVIVFGGLTILVVSILFLSKRFNRNNHNDPETNPLLQSDSMMFSKQIDVNSVKILHRIGKGTFGEVYKGIWNGTEVGVKFLTPPGVITDSFLQEFNKEVMIMRGCRHPNVLQFLGAGTNPPNICIVMEYMANGSVYKILHDENTKLELETLRKVMIDAARGMNYLHKSDPVIIHRDLKSHNLLVDENWKVKVCDFGLSKIMENNSEVKNMTACGTPSWTAPEILRNENYTEKADVYSFGIVLWECSTRMDPYEGMPPFQVVLSVGTKGMRPVIPDDCPSTWSRLILDCWDENPDNRPSFDEILVRLENMNDLKFHRHFIAAHNSST